MASQLEAGRGRKLWDYWVHGKGASRWIGSPTPYRTLLAELLSEGVPAGEAHGLAANIFHAALGRWPGKHDKGDHGNTPGDKVVAAVKGK
jgi:hypothetical protein